MPSHHQQQGSVIIDSQQAVGSQDSSGQFRFLPGQRSSQDSQSTPSLSNRSVPRFLEEAWARGEPQQQGARQAPSMPPPPPPPPPGTDHLHAAGTPAFQQLLMLTLQNRGWKVDAAEREPWSGPGEMRKVFVHSRQHVIVLLLPVYHKLHKVFMHSRQHVIALLLPVCLSTRLCFVHGFVYAWLSLFACSVPTSRQVLIHIPLVA